MFPFPTTIPPKYWVETSQKAHTICANIAITSKTAFCHNICISGKTNVHNPLTSKIICSSFLINDECGQ